MDFRNSFSSFFVSKLYCINIYFGRIIFLVYHLRVIFWFKIKSNIGRILNSERLKRYVSKTPTINGFEIDPPDVGDGIGGAILSLVLWIVFSILLVFLLPLLGLFFWSSVLSLSAMLYWIFFRALRLVFKNSGKCKGNLLKSIYFGLFYSSLYIFWIYGIIFLIKYIN
ncbi:hypothetical protein C1637_13815 [Chryseobacterium lactis]|uniref:Uncharacterized protein n=1 Tax=Chryseobacterium lactis TaxID=1241981 RepID=A0A3G6RQ79_CHRLC|nr:hypothetical protein [Chryseobacterium lactis]AZA83799.1 hypothetical protein EG342_18750 [Chryseobacterium lactis]AZB04184.1 hypothetical protein EG341_09625 [Chryseobacterium lactis]PNW12907.1 hypothetical protein C1637_13815 [Chryseobacterium lactis]